MPDELCHECIRSADMIKIRKEQLAKARQLLKEHLSGLDEDDPLIVIRPGAERGSLDA